jgi:long-subunit acyl-CoA synthetase (AMP-forming)
VRPGDTVSIVGPNRPEWTMADFGALAAGADAQAEAQADRAEVRREIDELFA